MPSPAPDPLALEDEQLLGECEVHTYKSSGPGGQHRNKVSSAVRLVHRPTGVQAHGDESRSQHENKRLALKRLRMHIALQLRRPVDLKSVSPATVPPELAECLHHATGTATGQRLDVGRRDRRLWPAARFVLDVLEACEARLSDAAALLGVTTANLVRFCRTDRHLFAAVQQMRQRHGLPQLR